ncbi:MAG: hypothetical protein K9L89_03155, partial [Kiritimatiellales bacterium]|nr:hypothetical protein [Kiritimatiellales bacterium]
LSELLKSEHPLVGEVKVRQKGGYPITLTYEPASADIFKQDKLGVEPLKNATTVSGHWFDAEPLIGDAEAALLQFSFELEEDEVVRLMAYYEQPAKVWLNGNTYAAYEPGNWSAGYHGPSFHRFLDYSPAVPLSRGRHTFTVALKNNTSGNHDVVVGVGDARKNLWISKALIA